MALQGFSEVETLRRLEKSGSMEERQENHNGSASKSVAILDKSVNVMHSTTPT